MKLRCATSRMRRHIRLNSGSVTPSNNQISPFGFDWLLYNYFYIFSYYYNKEFRFFTFYKFSIIKYW